MTISMKWSMQLGMASGSGDQTLSQQHPFRSGDVDPEREICEWVGKRQLGLQDLGFALSEDVPGKRTSVWWEEIRNKPASPFPPRLWRQAVASTRLTHSTHSLRPGGPGEEEARVLYACSLWLQSKSGGAPENPAAVLSFRAGQGPVWLSLLEHLALGSVLWEEPHSFTAKCI